jgi:hypothetical protein
MPPSFSLEPGFFPERRCGVCNDGLGPVSVRCRLCGAVFHPACGAAAVTCTGVGCQGSGPVATGPSLGWLLLKTSLIVTVVLLASLGLLFLASVDPAPAYVFELYARDKLGQIAAAEAQFTLANKRSGNARELAHAGLLGVNFTEGVFSRYRFVVATSPTFPVRWFALAIPERPLSGNRMFLVNWRFAEARAWHIADGRWGVGVAPVDSGLCEVPAGYRSITGPIYGGR